MPDDEHETSVRRRVTPAFGCRGELAEEPRASRCAQAAVADVAGGELEQQARWREPVAGLRVRRVANLAHGVTTAVFAAGGAAGSAAVSVVGCFSSRGVHFEPARVLALVLADDVA